MTYLIQPRAGESLCPTAVFDLQCAETRRNELTQLIIAKLVEEDQKEWAKSWRLKGENIPPYPQDQIHEKFYEQARKEAEKILEQERRNVVEQRSQDIRNTLTIIIRQLRLLVFTKDGKGKVYLQKEPIVGRVSQNGSSEREILFFESYPEGIERYHQIMQQKNRLNEYEDFFKYMNEECVRLYQEASSLADLEFVGKKDAEKKET